MNKKQVKELVNQFKLAEQAKKEAAKIARTMEKNLDELKETILALCELPKDKEGLKGILTDGQNLQREFGNFSLVLSRSDSDIKAHTRTTISFDILDQ